MRAGAGLVGGDDADGERDNRYVRHIVAADLGRAVIGAGCRVR